MIMINTVFMSFVGFLLAHIYYEPYKQYRDLKYKIEKTLDYYANIYGALSNKDFCDKWIEHCREGFDKIRECGCDVEAFICIMPIIHPFIPNKEELNKVHSHLIGLSNMSGHFNMHDNIEYKREIRRILKLHRC